MKRWRKVGWTFLVTAIFFFAFSTWAYQSRPGLVFGKDQYWRQILDNSPYLTKNIGPDGKYMKACQIIETGTLRGLKQQHEGTESLLTQDFTDTWHGPCYVVVNLGSEHKVIWGNKLVKVEHQLFHSVHVTIE